MFNYRSYSDLSTLILKKLDKFNKYDLFVGIPRSGMIPALMIAHKLNKPVCDLYSFVRHDELAVKGGARSDGLNFNIENVNNVLIIDDTIASGASMAKAELFLQENGITNYKTCAIYAIEQSKSKVDLFLEILPQPRVFEWNILQCWITDYAMFDLDGVLCLDPTVDDDGEKYIEYISNAVPNIIPTTRINTIVTCRLEKYRDITEKWLSENNISYDKLIMLPFNTKQERIAWGKHAEYKSEQYKNSSMKLFVESSKAQAYKIYEITKKPVFCIENNQLIQ